MDLKEIYLAKSQFVTRQVGDELIVVPLKGSVSDMNQLFTLNEVGTFIWNIIDGKNSEVDIVDAVSKEFDVESTIAEKDVSDFLFRLPKLLLK
jgi:methyltransferase-like protein